MPPSAGYRETLALLLVVGTLAGAAAACQGTKHVGPDRTVSIVLSEYRLAPDRVRASAGPLTLVIHNFGRLTHNLALRRAGKLVAESVAIVPGGESILAVDLTAGTYDMTSTLFEDESLGMHGTLTVTR